MRVLVLGGTIFLGRHVVEELLRTGHQVTLAHRGRHGPDLFPAVERIIVDRNGDLSVLKGRRFDAVVDTSAYLPRQVRASIRALATTPLYLFVSSVSVYPDSSPPGIDEDAHVATLDDPTVETVDGSTYGPLKAQCERVLQAELPGGALVVRPTLIVGPHDPTDRFTYWVLRLARGGPFLAPSDPNAPVQIIDVRDLAAWMVDSLVHGRTGVFNAVAEPTTMGVLFRVCAEVAGSDAEPCWASEQFLMARGVEPYLDMPLWLPNEFDALSRVDGSRAAAAGLTIRPLADTVRDTLEWARRRESGDLRAGLPPEREARLLDELRDHC